jgi:predicted metal-dependent TIM-barrel fold hydrolase
MGFSIYPDTKMDPDRMVAILGEYGTDRVLVNSAADWGHSDPLNTYRTGQAMLKGGFAEADVQKVLWDNPVAFYGQSGRLVLDDLPSFSSAADTFAGNSVLRGGR